MKKKFVLGISVLVVVMIATILLVGCGGNQSTEYDIVKKTKMENFELLNESALHNQIVFIGDSIIELFPTYELFAENDKIVYNRGISGDTSDRMLERFEKNALNINPDVVYILVGTNDIVKKIEHNVIIDNISKTIAKCKKSGVSKIIVSGLYPVNKSINSNMVGSRTNKEIKELNEKIKNVVSQYNAIFSDLTSVLADEDGNFNKEFTYDGLHPNAKGYIEIAKVIMPLIFGWKWLAI